MVGNRATVAVDNNTALPSLENYTLNAMYTLSEVGTGKVLRGLLRTIAPDARTLGADDPESVAATTRREIGSK